MNERALVPDLIADAQHLVGLLTRTAATLAAHSLSKIALPTS